MTSMLGRDVSVSEWEEEFDLVLEAFPEFNPIPTSLKIKEIESKRFAPAAIYLDDSANVLYLNCARLNELDMDDTVAVIAHELAHQHLGHLTHNSQMGENPFLVGLAQDMEVNEIIVQKMDLPSFFVTPTSNGLCFERNQNSEYYLNELKSVPESKLRRKFRIADSDNIWEKSY